MPNASINALRAQMISACPDLVTVDNKWWLLGTAGCHLCKDAEQLLMQLSAVYPIDYHKVDIAGFDEDLMMRFATRIPVLLTPNARLDWPFSIMDVQALMLKH